MKSTCNLAQKGVSFLIEIYISEGNTSEGKGMVYARRRTAKSTLLREKRRRVFMLKEKNG